MRIRRYAVSCWIFSRRKCATAPAAGSKRCPVIIRITRRLEWSARFSNNKKTAGSQQYFTQPSPPANNGDKIYVHTASGPSITPPIPRPANCRAAVKGRPIIIIHNAAAVTVEIIYEKSQKSETVASVAEYFCDLDKNSFCFPRRRLVTHDRRFICR